MGKQRTGIEQMFQSKASQKYKENFNKNTGYFDSEDDFLKGLTREEIRIEQDKLWDRVKAKEKQSKINDSIEKLTQAQELIKEKENAEKAKLTQLKIEETKSTIRKNEIITNSILLIVVLFHVYLLIKMFKSLKIKKMNRLKINTPKLEFTKIKSLDKMEINVVSVSSGLVVSIILGNIFTSKDHIKVLRNDSFEWLIPIDVFNYSLAIVVFLIVSISVYFLLNKIKLKNE